MQCIGGSTWKVQGVEFEAKLRLLPLVAYDMVLGMDWLNTPLGNTKVKWKNLLLERIGYCNISCRIISSYGDYRNIRSYWYGIRFYLVNGWCLSFRFDSDCFNDCLGLGLGTLSVDCIGSGSLVGFWFNENLSFPPLLALVETFLCPRARAELGQ